MPEMKMLTVSALRFRATEFSRLSASKRFSVVENAPRLVAVPSSPSVVK
jgi:hypothetical protein